VGLETIKGITKPHRPTTVATWSLGTGEYMEEHAPQKARKVMQVIVSLKPDHPNIIDMVTTNYM
jgi:hypothetical protein